MPLVVIGLLMIGLLVRVLEARVLTLVLVTTVLDAIMNLSCSAMHIWLLSLVSKRRISSYGSYYGAGGAYRIPTVKTWGLPWGPGF